MTLPDEAKRRLIRHLLTDAAEELGIAHAEIRRLKRLVEMKDQQIALLTERRVEFDLSADSTPMLCRRQAG